MRRAILAVPVLVFAFLALMPSASAEKRVALVIGNSAYQHLPPLLNPANDAKDIATELKTLGFHVIEAYDLNQTDMLATVRRFSQALEGADAGLFFYAGHGLQVGGINYLAPIDAKLRREGDLAFEAVKLDLVLEQLEREANTALIFLDACRDNPMAQVLARSKGARSASLGRGLARVDSGVGTFIAFSTQPGNVALDGVGRNSPFTAALVKHISEPGKDLSAVMIAVRNDVYAATSGKQVPWENSSLRSQFFFRPDAVVPKTAKPSATNPSPDFTEEAWAATKKDKFADLAPSHQPDASPPQHASVEPIDLPPGFGIAPVKPQSASPSAANSSSAIQSQYVVHVGSKQNQTEALATFADMQKKYPTLLARYRPMVQKADLGSEGVWYRLFIGPIADKETASRLCTQLKAQGHPACLEKAAPSSSSIAQLPTASPTSLPKDPLAEFKLRISDIRQPYALGVPEQFEIVIANAGPQTIEEITIGFMKTNSTGPCSRTLDSYDGFQTFRGLFVRTGDSVTLKRDFSAQAKSFCIVSARPRY